MKQTVVFEQGCFRDLGGEGNGRCLDFWVFERESDRIPLGAGKAGMPA
jgi:hypothetical protein